MGMVWRPGGDFVSSHWSAFASAMVILRNADTPVSADHGTPQEMTINTKAKYDSKCHGVPLSCGRVATMTMSTWSHCTQSTIPDLLCLVFGPQMCFVPMVFDQYWNRTMLENGYKCNILTTAREQVYAPTSFIRSLGMGVTVMNQCPNFDVWNIVVSIQRT